ncbi:hypothetical protein FLP10_04085 [Agromyces intestinalis]|uniref:Modulator of FtsH protease n=1 Tax=Agromyces intestinalis TaxID=2592652 RepID=A0A5C1YCD6_9MICO|nr:hypothetical protein [Agromyces intestinalis]QEO13691.1 hypothetical protein FLP10_04085 [Agromyces intestinalis]
MGELTDAWSEFNVAMLGATAALAGLVIVAMSVNLAEIMKTPSLPGRAAAALAALMAAIIVTAVGLVPDQPVVIYGVEVLFAGVLAAAFEYRATRLIYSQGEEFGPRWVKAAAGWLPVTLFLLGAVLVFAGSPAAALGCLAAASILAIGSAILHAWIVLVEVLR